MKKWKSGERVLVDGKPGRVVYVFERTYQLVVALDGADGQATVPMVACVAVNR